jgi:transcriptional regulator with XRE-family HTH domain
VTPIGYLIRREREAQGLTLADLARATGIAVPNLSLIETGAVDPRTGTIQRIAEALDADLLITPRARPVALDTIRERARVGRRAIQAANLSESDPAERLRQKASRGQDVRVETGTLIGT